MSLNLNWSRLDETVAHAVMALLNKKLAAAFHLPTEEKSSSCLAHDGQEDGSKQQHEFHTPRSPVNSGADDDESGRSFVRDGPRGLSSSTSFSSPPMMPPSSAADGGSSGTRTEATAVKPKQKQKQNSFRVEKFELSSLTWGDAPPFIEVITITDAMDFGPPTGASSGASGTPITFQQQQQQQQNRHQSSEHSPPRMSSSSDLPSNSSFSSSHALNTPTGSVIPSFGQHHTHRQHHRVPPLPIPSNSRGGGMQEVEDSLAKLFGKSGLMVRLHVTYGGQLSLTSCCSVRNQVNLAENFFIAVSLPMRFTVTQIHLNCNVTINLHRNACRIWLDPAPGNESPIQKVSIRAEVGDCGSGAAGVPRREGDGEISFVACNGSLTVTDPSSSVDTSSADKKKRNSADHHARGGSPTASNVCVDERAITQLVLTELRAVLSQKIVSPHFVEFPVTLP